MPVRFKNPGTRGPHFIAAWRRKAGMTQEQLGERIGMSKANISRIETREIPYTQDVIERLAVVFKTDPASLLSRDPADPEGLWSIWEKIPQSDRARAIEVLKALTLNLPNQGRERQ